MAAALGTAAPVWIKANGNFNNSRIASIQALVDSIDTGLLINKRGITLRGAMLISIIRDVRAIFLNVTNYIFESITHPTLIDLPREDLSVTVRE